MIVENGVQIDKKHRVRLGMVGGGQGALIGDVHRIAARMDDRYQLVAGALSSDPQRAIASALELGINEERAYADYQKMARRERYLDNGIDAVCIVTPNHLHFPIAKTFVDAGINVICDKPLVISSKEATALQNAVVLSGVLFAVTYNYSAYPMIRQAQEMVKRGELGDVRTVQVEYAQDWLSENLEKTGHKQAGWRTDPARAGPGGCIGDIGTHAFHLAGFVSGLKVTSINADLHTFVEGREVDDNIQVMMRFENGARGMLWASQVAPGNENGLRIRVYGSKGGLSWHQEEPNKLWFTPLGEATRLLTRAGAGGSGVADRLTRIPAGHPEGYLEGFANIYSEFADALIAKQHGQLLDAAVQFPSLSEGAEGVRFIEAALNSSQADGKWVML